MMRAALIRDYGAAPIPAEIEAPPHADGLVTVRVRAAAFNPVDALVTSGHWYGGNPALPFVPGREAAGVVMETTAGWAAGAEVYVRAPGAARGTMAGVVQVRPEFVTRVPPGLDPVAAAGLGFAGTTAALALRRAEVAAHDGVVVLAATGSVGRAAAQLAAAGGSRVVAVGRSRSDWEAGRPGSGIEFVASDELATAAEDDAWESALSDAITAALGGHANVVIDPLWGRWASAALRVLADGGRLVNIGSSAGSVLPLASELLRAKGIEIRGFSGAHVAPAEFAQACAEVLQRAAAEEIRLPTESFGLEDVGSAWTRAFTSPRTKVVVQLET